VRLVRGGLILSFDYCFSSFNFIDCSFFSQDDAHVQEGTLFELEITLANSVKKDSSLVRRGAPGNEAA